MAVPYPHKRSSVAGKVPVSADFDKAGQILVNTADGRAFINASGGVKTLPNTDDVGALSGFRNKIINGNFDVSQRGVGPFVIAAATSRYTADRWLLTSGTGASNTVDLVNSTGLDGAPTLRWVRNTTGSTESILAQRVEDVRTLRSGKATVTFLVWGVSGSSITLRVRQVFGTGGSTAVSVTVGSTVSVTSTWTKYTFSFNVPSISGKTIGAGSYVELQFVRPTAGGNNAIQLSRISQVEGDATAEADPFSPRHIQQELALCQRYGRLVALRDLWGGVGAGDYGQMAMDITDMRILPTIIATGKSDELINSTSPVVEVGAFGASKTLRAFAASATAGNAAFVAERFLDAEL